MHLSIGPNPACGYRGGILSGGQKPPRDWAAGDNQPTRQIRAGVLEDEDEASGYGDDQIS